MKTQWPERVIRSRWSLIACWAVPFILGGVLQIILPRPTVFTGNVVLNARVAAVIFAIFVCYGIAAYLIHRSLEMSARDLPWSMLVFLGTALVPITQFAFIGYNPCDLIVPSDFTAAQVLSTHLAADPGRALYFSTITFTSLGYGDLIPRAAPGRALAMAEALLGMANGVLFVLIFLRGGVPTIGPHASTRKGQRPG